MILLISVCKEKLHELEFVRPIEDILKIAGENYFIKNYTEVTSKDLKEVDQIIICGTSLKDNGFCEKKNLKFFEWVKDFDKPLLGICAGMQIIGLVYGGKVKLKTEIGYYFENFEKDYLGLIRKAEVWHLHKYFVDFSKLKNFEVFCSGNGISQAVKHRDKKIYGVLFHPEVRNKNLIEEFIKAPFLTKKRSLEPKEHNSFPSLNSSNLKHNG